MVQTIICGLHALVQCHSRPSNDSAGSEACTSCTQQHEQWENQHQQSTLQTAPVCVCVCVCVCVSLCTTVVHNAAQNSLLSYHLDTHHSWDVVYWREGRLASLCACVMWMIDSCHSLSSSLSKSPESSSSLSNGTTGSTVVVAGVTDDGLLPAMTSSRRHRRPITVGPAPLLAPPPHGVCVSTLRTRSSWSAIGARWPSGVATCKHSTIPHCYYYYYYYYNCIRLTAFFQTTWVSRHWKGKSFWILLEREMMGGSGISWTICKLFAPHSRQTTTPVPYRPDALPAGQPTASKHWRIPHCYHH